MSLTTQNPQLSINRQTVSRLSLKSTSEVPRKQDHGIARTARTAPASRIGRTCSLRKHGQGGGQATKGTTATKLGWPSSSKQWIGSARQKLRQQTPLIRSTFSWKQATSSGAGVVVRALRERQCAQSVAEDRVQRRTPYQGVRESAFPCSSKGPASEELRFCGAFRHPSLTKSGTCGTKATADCCSVIVRLRTSSSYWNVQGEYGPYSELFFFIVKKELVALTNVVPFKPVVPAETLKACALIGLHLLAAEGNSGSSSSCGVFSPELGGIPVLSGPMYPLWKDDVPFACEVFEHNSECPAVAGLATRGGDALSRGLGAWANSFELPHGHGPSLPRNEGCILGQLRVAGSPCSLCSRSVEGSGSCRSKRKPFSHRGRAVTERRGMW